MKASELRVGNWVQTDKNREYQIYLSWFECCKDSQWGRDIQLDTHPIPLTEEWLVKFGFKRDSTLYGETRKLGCFNIGKLTNGYFIEGGVDSNKTSINIQYVHQLQNLYFSLTNEELTINP